MKIPILRNTLYLQWLSGCKWWWKPWHVKEKNGWAFFWAQIAITWERI